MTPDRDPAGPVVVTGATGFLGTALVRRLLGEGRRVVAVAHSASRAANIPRDDDTSSRSHIDVRAGDLRNPEFAEEALKGAGAIVHLAAMQPAEGQPAQDLYHGNVDMAHAVTRAVSAQGVGLVVWASSALVYGTERPEPLDEDVALAPKGPYGMAKAAGECLARGAASVSGQTLTILRLFNCYGPGQGGNAFLGRLVAQARQGTGIEVEHLDAVRDFVFVDDVVTALVTAVDRGPGDTLILNIGSGSATPLAQAVEAVRSRAAAELDLRVRRRSQATDHLVADVSRAGASLGWQPRVGLAEGLARTMVDAGVACRAGTNGDMDRVT